MKSVVVQAATVAKAIESAWLKAGKPEEFFVRILQEHTSGFLGFGAQKAKIALFFKNSHKSDSLFPVVLNQKEYTNFFGNKSLKNPAELDVVDHELNKHVSLSLANHNQKKKTVGSDDKHTIQAKDNFAEKKNKSVEKSVHHAKQSVAQHQSKPIVQHHHKNQASQVVHGQKVQMSLQVPVVKVEQKKIVHNHVKNVVNKPVVPVTDMAINNLRSDIGANKEGLVESIAHALKKVQSQKIIANVSRNKPVNQLNDKSGIDKKPKVITPKFENYADFMDAQADKAAVKTGNVVAPTFEKIIEQSVQPVQSALLQPVPVEKIAPLQAKSKIVIKRRILTTENPGVSGITRSSDKKDESKKE